MKKGNRGLVFAITSLIISFLFFSFTVTYAILQIKGVDFYFSDIYTGRIRTSERGLENIPENLQNHVFFRNKRSGYLEELTGDITVSVVHISSPEKRVSPEDIATREKKLLNALGVVSSASKTYSATVKFTVKNYETEVAGEIELGKVDKELLRQIAADALGMEMDKYQKKTRSPIIFMIPQEGRSYSTSANEYPIAEYVVLFKGKEADLTHEILHLYGAKDYYYPSSIKEKAEERFPRSIMGEGNNFDELTAFLVGWKDDLKYNSLFFLWDTVGVTQAELVNAANMSFFTGVGTVEFSNGIYSGDLVHGIPHGKGEYIYNTGKKYTGDFVNGKYDGYGVLINEQGYRYEGEFYKGVKCGYGLYYHKEGYLYYIGEWENNQWHGEGIMIDLNKHHVYEGSFINGSTIDGIGVHVWTRNNWANEIYLVGNEKEIRYFYTYEVNG